MRRSPVVGLALGGGGARGLAHIGVLRVLEREDFRFDILTGTSMGAVVGAMYAQLGSADRVQERLRSFLQSDTYRELNLDRLRPERGEHDFFGHVMETIRERVVINLALSRRAMIDGEKAFPVLERLVEPGRIENLPIRFATVAVDLISGKEVILASGDIRKAVLASGSLPGFLPPCEADGKLLVDGAVRATLPVLAARRLGADFVVAVDVSQDLDPDPELDHVVDILARSHAVLADAHRFCLRDKADVVIRPNVGHIHWTRFDLLELLVAEGEKAAEDTMAELREGFWRSLPLLERARRKLSRVR